MSKAVTTLSQIKLVTLDTLFKFSELPFLCLSNEANNSYPRMLLERVEIIFGKCIAYNMCSVKARAFIVDVFVCVGMYLSATNYTLLVCFSITQHSLRTLATTFGSDIVLRNKKVF